MRCHHGDSRACCQTERYRIAVTTVVDAYDRDVIGIEVRAYESDKLMLVARPRGPEIDRIEFVFVERNWSDRSELHELMGKMIDEIRAQVMGRESNRCKEETC